MKKLNYLVASLFAATMLATPACNKEDIEDPIINDDTIGPKWIIEEYINDALGFCERLCNARDYQPEESNFFAKKAAELFQKLQSQKTTKSYSPTDINSDDHSIGNFVYNTNSQYNITQEDTPLPKWEETSYGGSYLNTQTEIVEYNGKTYLLVVMSKRGHQPGEYFGNTGGGEGFLKWGTLYESDIASHTTYSKTDEYVWLVHEIKLDTGVEIIYPLIVNNKAQRSYTNPIIITSKKGLVVSNWRDITIARSVYGTVCGTEVKCSSKNNADYYLTNDLSCVGYCKTWSSSIFNITLGASGDAWNWFNNRSSDSRFATYRNGSTEPPREGDIIAMHGKGSTGHVVVIYYVDYQNGKVYVAHQNGGKGKDCPPIGCALDLICQNGSYSIEDHTINNYTIDGWIRTNSKPDNFRNPTVKEEILAITQCAINGDDIANYDSRDFTEGDEIKIVAWSLYDGDFIISINGEEYVGPKYIMENAQPGTYEVSVWIEANGKQSDKYEFTITVKKEDNTIEVPSVKTVKVNNKSVGRNQCYPLDYVSDIVIEAISDGNCKTKISVDGNTIESETRTISFPESRDYEIKVWNEIDGNKSDIYEFIITVKKEVKIESNIASGSYVSRIDDFVRMYITYNNEDIYLHGSAGANLDVTYKYDGKKVQIIGDKSTGSFSQKGTAVLFKNGFKTVVGTKNYYSGDENVTFEIDPESITDITEYRIALIIEYTTKQGGKYRAGYYSAPVILNREGGDTERSYSINPSVGNTVPNPSSNRTYTIKDNWDDQNDFSNNFKKHYVENISGCNAKIKVLRISGDKITLRISKNEGFTSQGRIIVYEGTSIENIWFSNLLAEKGYNSGATDIDITFDVSHLTGKSQFGIVILGTKPWDDNELHGYYSGTITVTPR